jgi:hypothetical protein
VSPVTVRFEGRWATGRSWPLPGFPGGCRKLTLAGTAIAPKVSFLALPCTHTCGQEQPYSQVAQSGRSMVLLTATGPWLAVADRPAVEFHRRQRIACPPCRVQFSFPPSPPTLNLPAPSNAMATAVKR